MNTQEETLPTWECEKCGADFDAGQWLCADGSRHRVALKKYFLPGEQQQYGTGSDGKPLPKHSRTTISNIPPFFYFEGWQPGCDDEGVGGSVEFINNRFETTDPEQQFWLDQRSGFCTEKHWQEIWLSPEELRARDVAEVARLEKEVEELRKRTGKRGKGSVAHGAQ